MFKIAAAVDRSSSVAVPYRPTDRHPTALADPTGANPATPSSGRVAP